jgi:hypothetical protein
MKVLQKTLLWTAPFLQTNAILSTQADRQVSWRKWLEETGREGDEDLRNNNQSEQHPAISVAWAWTTSPKASSGMSIARTTSMAS